MRDGGPTTDGGGEEWEAGWPSWASSSRSRSRWATISARAAAGVAAQISGGRGCSIGSMPKGIRRRRRPASPALQAGLNAENHAYSRLRDEEWIQRRGVVVHVDALDPLQEVHHQVGERRR